MNGHKREDRQYTLPYVWDEAVKEEMLKASKVSTKKN
jgi:hypothetical protein